MGLVYLPTFTIHVGKYTIHGWYGIKIRVKIWQQPGCPIGQHLSVEGRSLPEHKKICPTLLGTRNSEKTSTKITKAMRSMCLIIMSEI